MNRQDRVRALIYPLLTATYGGGSMTGGLADALAGKIARNEVGSRGREHMIMVTCWDWFPGGVTAANVATKIEKRINDANT